MGQATDFLTAFFAGMPAGQSILVWTIDGQKKTSWWGDSVTAVTPIAERECAKAQNTYFGVGSRRPGKHICSTERGRDSDVSFLYAMWLDIDIKCDAHAKENLPEDESEALSILEAVPLEPSALIRSGHGLQAFWFLDAPLTIGLGTDGAKRLTSRWNYTFKKFAQRSGWDVDSVFDLARVMRLPGSRNVKHGGDLLVETVFCHNDIRYSLDELMEYCVAEDAIPDTTVAQGVLRAGDITLSLNAQVNFDKFEALCDNHPDFRSTWNHQKKVGSDGSMSAYDMSVSSMAAYAGWTIQEIVDLLIAHRRKYKDLDGSNKEQRFDYLERTARKAWLDAQDKERREASKALLTVRADEVQESVEATVETQVEETPSTPEAVWEAISAALGLEVSGMRKFSADEPIYWMTIGGTEYEIGTIENITSWSRFQNKIATHTGRAIPVFKGTAWSNLWSRMLMSAQTVSIADGGSARVLYADRFLQWLENQTVIKVAVEMEMGEGGTAYECGRYTYFSLDDFYRWLKVYHHDTITRSAVARVLRLVGASPKHITVERDGKQSSKNVWKMDM